MPALPYALEQRLVQHVEHADAGQEFRRQPVEHLDQRRHRMDEHQEVSHVSFAVYATTNCRR